MTSCEHDPSALDPTMDGEASPTAQPECASCRRQLHALRAVKAAVGRLPSRMEPSSAVRARVEALRYARPATGTRVRRFAAPAALVALGLAAAVFLLVMRGHDDGESVDDLVADHLRSVPPTRPAEIASGERSEVLRFFSPLVDFRAAAPTLPGSRLVGGRLCTIRRQTVELLFYQYEERTLSLFVGARPFGIGRCSTSRDHSVCETRVADRSLVLVGALPADELRSLLDQVSL